MRHITAADITAFEKVYRLNFVNGLPGFKPANLVGTAAPNGRTNLAIFSSVLHLGSDPAVLGMVTRPLLCRATPTRISRTTAAATPSTMCR
jgi:hypothetical protein